MVEPDPIVEEIHAIREALEGLGPRHQEDRGSCKGPSGKEQQDTRTTSSAKGEGDTESLVKGGASQLASRRRDSDESLYVAA